MALIAGLSLGFLLGLCAIAMTWSREEKRDVKRGFTEIDGNFYRLTPISLWDANKDDLWRKVWDEEGKL